MATFAPAQAYSRKKRVFVGLAGSPLARITKVRTRQPQQPNVHDLMDNIAAAETTTEVRKVLREYDSERYRTEINKVLARHRTLEKSDFDELEQRVNIEVWKATEHYGDGMNHNIAFKVARNVVATFYDERSKQPKPESLSPNREDKDGFEYSSIETEVAEQQLKSVKRSEHDRFLVLAMFNGVEVDEAIAEINGDDDKPRHFQPEQLETLGALVEQWSGTKRRVGRHLLKHGPTNVRGVRGVPKSTAARLMKEVLKEFREKLGVKQP